MKKQLLMLGNNTQINIPKDIERELDSVLETAIAVKGKPFGEHVKFLMNTQSLLSLVITSTTIRPEVNEDSLKDAICHVASVITRMHADAVGIDPDDFHEATKTAEALRSLIDECERRINDKP
jgi:hypothetical protein